jgi:hypothetical protein
MGVFDHIFWLGAHTGPVLAYRAMRVWTLRGRRAGRQYEAGLLATLQSF